jgi:hypothetical protein
VVEVTGFLTFSASLGVAKKARKRQTGAGYLKIQNDGTVIKTTTCGDASIIVVELDGRLTVGGLSAMASAADVNFGIAPLTFGPDNPANIETAFSVYGGSNGLQNIQWVNAAFTGSGAIFAFPPTSPVLNVIFDGDLPAGYTAVSFGVLTTGSPAALGGK